MTPVLRVGPLMPDMINELENQYGAAALETPDKETWKDFSAGPVQLEDLKVAVTSGRTGIPVWLMDALPNLEAIVNFGVGYDKIDVQAATSRGIAVANTPDVLTDCVADTALGLIIATLRRLPAADQYVRTGQWSEAHGFPLARKVSGKRFGVLGLGRIGRATATRLEAFSDSIGYHSRREVADVPYTYYQSPTELAAASDVLVITASGGPASEGLVDSKVLEALGPAGFVINVARGSILDQEALITALESGTISGAGLDTFAHEPQVPEALLSHQNVVVLPHLASGTIETRGAMRDLVLANVANFLRDRQLVTPVMA